MSGPSVKIPADWLDSDQIEDLGADAVLLMLTALAHSARQTSEGVVPRRQLRKLWPVADIDGAIAALVAAGEVEDRGADLYFVKWGEFLLSAEEVDRIKEQNRIRDERRRRHNKGDHAMCLARYCSRAQEEQGAPLTRESHVSPRVAHADPIRTYPIRPDPTVGRGSGGEKEAGEQSAHGSAAPPAAVAEVEPGPALAPPPSLPESVPKGYGLKISAVIAAQRRFGMSAHKRTDEPRQCCKAPDANPIHDVETAAVMAEQADDLAEFVAYWEGVA